MSGPKHDPPHAETGAPAADTPGPRFGIVHVLATITAALGLFMIVRALAGGGGLGSYGVLVGSLFLAAGLLRLRLMRARSVR